MRASAISQCTRALRCGTLYPSVLPTRPSTALLAPVSSGGEPDEAPAPVLMGSSCLSAHVPRGTTSSEHHREGSEMEPPRGAAESVASARPRAARPSCSPTPRRASGCPPVTVYEAEPSTHRGEATARDPGSAAARRTAHRHVRPMGPAHTAPQVQPNFSVIYGAVLTPDRASTAHGGSRSHSTAADLILKSFNVPECTKYDPKIFSRNFRLQSCSLSLEEQKSSLTRLLKM